MRRLVFITLAMFATAVAHAEYIAYSIYSTQSKGRVLLDEGTRQYSLADINDYQSDFPDGTVASHPSLLLENGFRVGILVKPERELTGFGLWVRNDRSPEGFSWEWFRHEQGDIFVKLQGPGRLRVSVDRDAEFVRLSSVEFLDDIELRFQQNMYLARAGDHTHVVLVKQGSVLMCKSAPDAAAPPGRVRGRR